MSALLVALWPWLIAITVICAVIWFAHKPIDAEYQRPTRRMDVAS